MTGSSVQNAGAERSTWSLLEQSGERPAMCNHFGNRVPYAEYLHAFSEIQVPVRLPSVAPNLEPHDDIWPTEAAPVFRRRRCRMCGRPSSNRG
jgi:hypothetical protein